MEIEIAERLEPDSWVLKAAHATILYYARRYDESLAIIGEIAKGSKDWNLGDLMAQDYWAKSMPGRSAHGGAAAAGELFAAHTHAAAGGRICPRGAGEEGEGTARELIRSGPRRRRGIIWRWRTWPWVRRPKPCARWKGITIEGRLKFCLSQ